MMLIQVNSDGTAQPVPENLPVPKQPGGALVHAGEMNVTAPITVEITAAGNDTFLSELVRLMASAEQGQSRHIRIADRLARFYSPAVHTLAATTLIGWLVLGHGWHDALMAAVLGAGPAADAFYAAFRELTGTTPSNYRATFTT